MFLSIEAAIDMLYQIGENKHFAQNIVLYACDLVRIRQRKCTCFTAFCLYESCSHFEASRTYKEIANDFNITVTNIVKCCRNSEKSHINWTKPSDLSPRVFYNLNITDRKQRMKLSKRADYIFMHVLRSSPPQSALALAILEEGLIPLKQIANICNISPQCLRSCQHRGAIAEKTQPIAARLMFYRSSAI